MPDARILVTGSRHWVHRPTVVAALRWLASEIAAANNCRPDELNITLVHGDARGLDTIAGEVAATEFGWAVEAHPADWDRHGRSAGHRRNHLMVSLGATAVIGFPLGTSAGTRNCLNQAMAAGLSTYRVDCDETGDTGEFTVGSAGRP